VNTLLDETDDREDHRSRANQGTDREITLGTSMILLIFFALAVYGAVLFGFGYSLGSKHTESTSGTAAAPPTGTASFSAFKPSPGSPVGAPSAEKPPAATSTETKTVSISEPAPAKAETAETKVIASASDFEDTAAKSKTAPPPPAAASAVPATPAAIPIAANGTVVVQVAAVSHQEDADLIATTLKRRGYVVNIRTEADKLLHVQVGPFSTHKDAEAMKAKLLADGFNAYIK
jgi:DedD protein